MTTLTTARVTSWAPPQAFFERWADMATWSAWNSDTAWVTLHGPFAESSTRRLKPKGGPSVPFVIERLVPDRQFVDVSRLVGARLTFDHRVSVSPDGRTVIDVTVTLTGPLRRLWQRVLGKDVAAGVQPDLENLARVAETVAGTTR